MAASPLQLGLVFGGVSGEHAVSIRSANTVAAALRRGANAERYQLRCFYIDQWGHWWPPAVADAVLGQRQMRASVLGEICFEADWYDYDTKYSEGKSHTVIPAQVPADLGERARAMAIAACRAVGASGLARVDFFYSEASGELWLNEINTLPGFTSQSMYPMLWEASGVPLEELVHQLVQLAQESEHSSAAGGLQAA